MSTIRGGKVTLAEVLRLWGEARDAELRVSGPGLIEKFDSKTQLASVRLCLKDTEIAEDGTESAVALPVVSDVPCHFPGGGGFSITWPVKKGDPCWLVFSDRSIDKWLDSGQVVDPVAMHRHGLTDACAFLGVRAKPKAIAKFNAACMTAGKDGEPEQFAALANLVKDEIKAVRDSLNALWTHQHTGTVDGATCTTTVTTPPTIPANPPAAVKDVASKTFKIKG